MDDKYDFLEHKDGHIKLSPRQTDYLLFLLKGVIENNPHLEVEKTHEIKDIINKLELSRGKG